MKKINIKEPIVHFQLISQLHLLHGLRCESKDLEHFEWKIVTIKMTKVTENQCLQTLNGFMNFCN